MASGPAESISLAGRRFVCNNEDDVSIQLHGFTNETQMHGDGSSHVAKSRKPGVIDSINVYIDPQRDDLEYLQGLANRMETFDVSITLVDGIVYSGSMQLVGDSTALGVREGFAPITLSGSVLEKQG